MPSCKEVATAVSSGEIESAGFWRRIGIRLHLWICEPCRTYVRQMRQLGDAARRTLGSSGDSAGRSEERLQSLEERLVERCGESATETTRSDGPPT